LKRKTNQEKRKMDKEIAKRTPDEIAACKSLMENDFTGFEDQTAGMLTLPFLKICQTNTMVQDNRADASEPLESGRIPGLRPGMLYNSQTGRVYGKKLKVIPLHGKESYLHYGAGLGNFKGEYATIDDVDALVKKGELVLNKKGAGWHGRNDENEKCFYAITFLVFIPDYPEDGILPFVLKGKSIKYAKVWNSLSTGMTITVGKTKKKANRYHYVWNIETKPDKNEAGTWYNVGNSEGTGISCVGTIFDDMYSKIMPALNNAVEVVRAMRESKQKINYANDKQTDDEEVPIDGGLNPFDEE
jgi:hypothetical protein